MIHVIIVQIIFHFSLLHMCRDQINMLHGLNAQHPTQKKNQYKQFALVSFAISDLFVFYFPSLCYARL